jgi:hypothetical protein
MPAVVVQQKMLLPPSRQEWGEVVPRVVNDLQQENQEVYMADNRTDSVDIMFVFYEAADHERVEDESILKTLVETETATIGRLVLCACDVSEPEVSIYQVRDLLITQVKSTNLDMNHFREQTVGNLLDTVRSQISQRVFQVGLTRPIALQGSEVGPTGESLVITRPSQYSRGSL